MQKQLTEEDLKNMSPEEIAKLQQQNCIFCKIISGEVASKKIYEDEKCLAILDINPANPGHILLLTKKHFQVMPQVPDKIISHLFSNVKFLSKCALKGIQAEGTNIVVANGMAAGQKAPHFMIHIIPRKEGDGLDFDLKKTQIPEKNQEILRKKIRQKTNELFGIVDKESANLNSKPAKIEQKVVDAEFTEKQSTDKKKTEEKQDSQEKQSEGKSSKQQKASSKTSAEGKKPNLDKISGLFG
ncbi:MAG: hypothetical protein MAG795_01120 [Candidatus Woesearchaeota archaeon]|nr:hypothetical protein [Candidatus Woesearchaeota archaeon]